MKPLNLQSFVEGNGTISLEEPTYQSPRTNTLLITPRRNNRIILKTTIILLILLHQIIIPIATTIPFCIIATQVTALMKPIQIPIIKILKSITTPLASSISIFNHSHQSRHQLFMIPILFRSMVLSTSIMNRVTSLALHHSITQTLLHQTHLAFIHIQHK